MQPTRRPPNTRSVMVRGKLLSAAEHLYAERGFAGVSLRQIATAAGQRNNTAVQYHFTGREDLIKAVLADHAEAIDRHRLPMVEALGPPEQTALADQIGCVIVPVIEHHINLGNPSWYARFLTQALVEPQLREHAITTYSRSRSLCKLKDLGHLGWSTPPGAPVVQLHTVIQHLLVHMCAELETDLARDTAIYATAEPAWRLLGGNLIQAACGMVTALTELRLPGLGQREDKP